MVSDIGISPTVCINHAAATPAASAGTVCEGVPVRYSQGPLWPRAAIAKGRYSQGQWRSQDCG